MTANLPWVKPAALPWAQPERPLADTVKLLQADVAYLVKHTAVAVHATGEHAAALSMLVNTARGQLVPTGVGRLTQGHSVVFHDLGMPQVGAPSMTVQELVQKVYSIAAALGLELEV